MSLVIGKKLPEHGKLAVYANNVVPSVFVYCLAIVSQTATAITIDLPANLELSGTTRVEALYDDNVFLTSENTRSDWLTRATPSLGLVREGADTSLTASYSMTRGVYLDETRDNFIDYSANMDWRWRTSGLLELRATASYVDIAQSVAGNAGESLDPILIEPGRTRRPASEMALILGRQDGNLQGIIRRGRQKNDFEDSTRDFVTDYSAFSINYTFYDQVTVGIQAMQTEFLFEDLPSTPERDSTEKQVLLVAEYRLPKTRLQVRAGPVQRTFEQEERAEFDGPRWDLTATWSPRSYSTFSVTTGRNLQESRGVADFVDVQSSSISWSHQWTERFTSLISYSETNGEFVGVVRDDEVLRSNIAFQYQPLDWLRFEMGISNLENRSSERASSLENNRYTFSIEAPL